LRQQTVFAVVPLAPLWQTGTQLHAEQPKQPSQPQVHRWRLKSCPDDRQKLR